MCINATRRSTNYAADTVYFRVLATDQHGKKVEHEIYAKCGPGDTAAPVITIMLIIIPWAGGLNWAMLLDSKTGATWRLAFIRDKPDDATTDLPACSFSSVGTNQNTMIVTMIIVFWFVQIGRANVWTP